MDSSPSPDEPAEISPDELERGGRVRKLIWVVSTLVLVTPLAWVPVVILSAVLSSIFSRYLPWQREEWVMCFAAVVALVVAAGVARRGLRNDWHLRATLLRSWSLAAVVALGLTVWTGFKMRAIRQAAKEKAVMSNLRGIAATADQFLGEFGADRIFLTRDELIGSTRYMKVLNRVDDEDYGTVFPVRRDHDETLTVTLPDGRETQRTEPLAVTMRWGTVVHYYVPSDKDDGGRKQDGVHTLKLPDGRYFKVTYRGGVPDGPFRAFDADGKLWGEATYERGRVVGPCWLYTRDGKKSDELKDGEAITPAREGK